MKFLETLIDQNPKSSLAPKRRSGILHQAEQPQHQNISTASRIALGQSSNPQSTTAIMSKKVAQDVIVKLIVGAGQASPSPPVGPALGSKGVKSMDFCKVRISQVS
jgi:hypothetical protein